MRLQDYASPEELKRLGAAFLTVLVALCLAAVFEFIVVPSLRIANRPPHGADIPAQGATGWLDPTEYPAAKGFVVPPLDPKAVMEASPALLARGRELFAKDCAQCHGAEGRGNGPAAKTTSPAPRDFTQAKAWKNGFGLAGIFKTVTSGSAGSAMAAFDYIPGKDRMALAHYVQSLGSFPHPEAPAALAALAKSFAAASEVIPDKIPASLAVRKLVEEYAAPAPLVLSAAARRAISDPGRAALWLRNGSAWRKGPRALARAAALQAPDNGFSVSAAELDPAAWSALFAQLRGQVRP